MAPTPPAPPASPRRSPRVADLSDDVDALTLAQRELTERVIVLEQALPTRKGEATRIAGEIKALRASLAEVERAQAVAEGRQQAHDRLLGMLTTALKHPAVIATITAILGGLLTWAGLELPSALAPARERPALSASPSPSPATPPAP